ncbi:hypothetical protein PMAYCL1PPCAC_13564, partial [Pristionchus mayeri]
YRKSSESGATWRAVGRARCERGDWVAETEGGNISVDASLEFQCSSTMPVEALIIGCSVGGVLLLVAILVGLLIF